MADGSLVGGGTHRCGDGLGAGVGEGDGASVSVKSSSIRSVMVLDVMDRESVLNVNGLKCREKIVCC